MSTTSKELQAVADELLERLKSAPEPRSVLRAPELRALYTKIPTLPEQERAAFGQAINKLKAKLEAEVAKLEDGGDDQVTPIDVTAPFDVNVPADKRPVLLPTELGSQHPITQELERVVDIFTRMGFTIEDSRQLDNDFNMFTALNFPDDHPARDDYDTFMTDEGLIPPAHTSTMQHRILKSQTPPIRALIPGRVFRNEDVDTTHEHTFYQFEGIYVDKGITVADMLGTILRFLEEYFGEQLEYKTQPFFFPFVEPGLEFLIKMPKALRKSEKDADSWLEIMGCGMIHPNVLKQAGIDPAVYSGFAWGGGIDRLVILRQGIEDIRLFHGGRLEFLRKFA